MFIFPRKMQNITRAIALQAIACRVGKVQPGLIIVSRIACCPPNQPIIKTHIQLRWASASEYNFLHRVYFVMPTLRLAKFYGGGH